MKKRSCAAFECFRIWMSAIWMKLWSFKLFNEKYFRIKKKNLQQQIGESHLVLWKCALCWINNVCYYSRQYCTPSMLFSPAFFSNWPLFIILVTLLVFETWPLFDNHSLFKDLWDIFLWNLSEYLHFVNAGLYKWFSMFGDRFRH